MRYIKRKIYMKKHNFKAVIFDLDGVITKTALVHSAAWKKMFNDYLREREQKYGEPFKEFTHEYDYLTFVDGKPRYDGVQSFLESRNINLPFGDPSDPPGKETVCGLGNRKNKAFNEVLDAGGVEVYSSTVELIRDLKKSGIKIGVASSSKNCKPVLKKAGLLDMFETRVDGVVSAELKLNGKPEPDIFTTAADNLGVPYDQTVVVEDAVSGVQAGKKGNFGLVLGIARENNEKELKINGADIVVADISEIGFDGIRKWFEDGLEKDNWSLTYSDYVPGKEKTRETLLTVGNGYFGTRGALEECYGGQINYPGTYIAGLYNRLVSKVGERDVENEDFVNCPNWLPVRFKVEDEEWIKYNSVEIIDIERRLDFKTGLLYRQTKFRDNKGREFILMSKRFASMHNPHLAAIYWELTPLNFSGEITVESVLDGAIINDGVERYRQLNQKHLEPVSEDGYAGNSALVVKTTQSGIEIAEAAGIVIFENGRKINPQINIETEPGRVHSVFTLKAEQNKPVGIEKIVSIFTSKHDDSRNPLSDAKQLIENAGSFAEEFEKSGKRWEAIWKEIDIQLEGDRLAQKLLRLHLYHLFVSMSPHNAKIDASITARGLHGEAYRGHIFWDELFILPLYDIHFPEVSKAALMYRYRRLDKAREYAKQYGYKGAMFPWQSGSDGREETQVVHLNPVTGKWGPDFSSLQRHISLAVAFNTYRYYHITEDSEFMEKYGMELFLEICRFWESKTYFDKTTGRYSIKNVMGPDEFHEKYPGTSEGGLKDNTYTNIMVVWAFSKANELLDKMDETAKRKVFEKIDFSNEELQKWSDITRKMNIVIQDDILSQYDGYFDLKELDWEEYRNKYGNIYRMDRLLKAEGKSADEYKVAKQADTLQLFYNLDKKDIDEILKSLNYHLSNDYLTKNLKYYLARTSHGSTLSRVVHAHLANMVGDKELSLKLYYDALTSDYNDIQGGTTGEGIHAGVMAGTILIALQSYAGLNLNSDKATISPNLPEHWRKISFGFQFKNVKYKCVVGKELVEIMQTNKRKVSVEVLIDNKIKVLVSDEQYNINI